MGKNLMLTDFVVLTFFVFVCRAALLLSLPLLQRILMQLYSSSSQQQQSATAVKQVLGRFLKTILVSRLGS
jgi:hypothetical protein